VLGEIAPAQAEHRVRLVEGPGDRELGVGGVQGGGQALDEVRGQEGRVAGRGDHERVARAHQRGMQAGERTGEAADVVAEHRMTEGLPGREVLVGVDDQLVDLGGEAGERVRRHRLPGELDQALVHAAHAAALAAGEQHPGDAAVGGAGGGGVAHRAVVSSWGVGGVQSRSKRSAPEKSR
jgi:hypothetical protein